MTGRNVVPDVLVVGGGPAGSTVAGLLAADGWRVEILDRARFPRPKACGECLNPGAVATLGRLGLLDAVLALEPARLEGWEVRDGSRGSRARGRFGPDVGPGLGVSRRRLDAALLDEARRRGAFVREGVHVVDVVEGSEERRSHPRVRTRGRTGSDVTGSNVLEARLVVGADGLRSVVARSISAVTRRPKLRKVSLSCRLRGSGPELDRGRLVLDDGGTVGLAPVGWSADGETLWNGTVVVDADRDGARMARDPAGFAMARIRRAIPDWSAPPELVEGPWASGPFDWPTERVVADGVLLVGDAAGYYDPLTGQGIFRALRSAELAARTIDSALAHGRVSEGSLTSYQRALRPAFGPGRRIQRLVERVVSRAALRAPVLHTLEACPSSMDALIRVTGDARPVRSLLRPRAWPIPTP